MRARRQDISGGDSPKASSFVKLHAVSRFPLQTMDRSKYKTKGMALQIKVLLNLGGWPAIIFTEN
jgi:hypothetical protein